MTSTAKPSFIFRVFDNIRVALVETQEELKNEVKVDRVGYGEDIKGRKGTYIDLNDVRGESGQGFRYTYATNRGAGGSSVNNPNRRGSMTRNAKGVLIFDINLYRRDSNDVDRRFYDARNAYQDGWRILEVFECKIGNDVTLGFPDPYPMVPRLSVTDKRYPIQVPNNDEYIRFINYELDEVYGNLNLSDVDGADRFLNINVRVSINARLDVPII